MPLAILNGPQKFRAQAQRRHYCSSRTTTSRSVWFYTQVVVAARSQDKLQAVAEEIKAAGGEAAIAVGDVTKVHYCAQKLNFVRLEFASPLLVSMEPVFRRVRTPSNKYVRRIKEYPNIHVLQQRRAASPPSPMLRIGMIRTPDKYSHEFVIYIL